MKKAIGKKTTGKKAVVGTTKESGGDSPSKLIDATIAALSDWIDGWLARVSGKEVPMPYAANLEAMVTPDVPRIVAAVKRAMYLTE